MKKMLSLVLTAVMLCTAISCFAFSAGAAEKTTVIFEGKTYEMAVGDTFVFETRLTAPGVSAAGGKVNLKFDANLIETVKNNRRSIYETDIEDVTTVGGNTAGEQGCSFAFAGTQYSEDNILSGEKNLYVRFLFRARAAGTTEIVFDNSSFDFSVFADEEALTPTQVVKNGVIVNGDVDYTFIGNEIIVREI